MTGGRSRPCRRNRRFAEFSCGMARPDRRGSRSDRDVTPTPHQKLTPADETSIPGPRRRVSPSSYANAVDGAVVDDPHSQGSLHDVNPVHLSEENAPTDPGGIVDRDFVLSGLTTNRHLE